jgi:hypothetical protein
MVKKLLDTVPDQLYPAVAGIEQFYERSRWRSQVSHEWRDDQLMLTEAE